MDIAQKLDQLAEFMSQRDLIGIHKQEVIDSVLTPEIKAKLADIETEFKRQEKAVDDNIDLLTCDIKLRVIESGATAKGAHLQAVFTSGKYSYSEDAKPGYEAVMIYRKKGEPSVSIRKIG